jgi:phytoene synthase
MVEQWINTIHKPDKNEPVQQQLYYIIKKYHIPLWPWESFTKSMLYDLEHDGFASIQTFFQYAEGASIAPASIFIHLCGVQKKEDHFVIPRFDIRNTAESAALFAYIVHIIRDFQKDQRNNLNYFADDVLHTNGLNREKLKHIATGGSITSGFRNLIKTYYDYGEFYRRKTRETIDTICTQLEPQYHLSLEILYSLYLQIFERIDIEHGRFTTKELNPTPQQIKERIRHTFSNFKSTYN